MTYCLLNNAPSKFSHFSTVSFVMSYSIFYKYVIQNIHF